MSIWSSLDLDDLEPNASGGCAPKTADDFYVDVATCAGWSRLRLSIFAEHKRLWAPGDPYIFLTPAQARVIAERLIRAADLTDRFSA